MSDNDKDAESIYLKHIQERVGAHHPLASYLPAARYLARSMQDKGFDARYPVPVNRKGVLLGGAHRTSCAFVLGKKIIVERMDTDHQWPDWGRQWFLDHGMAEELPWMERDLTEIQNAQKIPHDNVCA